MNLHVADSTTPVWSKFVRCLHWTIASCVIANLINRGDLRDLHKIVGYICAAAVLIRVAHGLGLGIPNNGKISHSLFSAWPLSPAKLILFIKSELKKEPLDYEGHNPAASWVYFGIWTLITGLAVTGFMMGLDAYQGEEWLEELHEVSSNLLIALVIVHGLGIAKDAITRKRPTWKGMITGHRGESRG